MDGVAAASKQKATRLPPDGRSSRVGRSVVVVSGRDRLSSGGRGAGSGRERRSRVGGSSSSRRRAGRDQEGEEVMMSTRRYREGGKRVGETLTKATTSTLVEGEEIDLVLLLGSSSKSLAPWFVRSR